MALVHTVAEGKIQNTRYTRAHTNDTQISQKVLSLSSIVSLSSIMVMIDSRQKQCFKIVNIPPLKNEKFGNVYIDNETIPPFIPLVWINRC